MSIKTITIERGNQYDPKGYRATDGILYAYGSIADNELGFTMNGHYFADEQIHKAIKAVLADSLTREITIGATRREQQEEIPESGACPKCGTYCFGDCES